MNLLQPSVHLSYRYKTGATDEVISGELRGERLPTLYDSVKLHHSLCAEVNA